MAVLNVCMPRLLLPAFFLLSTPSGVAAGSANATKSDPDDEELTADDTGLLVGMAVGMGVLLLVFLYCWLTRRTSRISVRHNEEIK